MSTKTRRRLIPAGLLLGLALTATLLVLPTATSDAGIDPCHQNCSNAALACSIGCFEEHRWDPDALKKCQWGCEVQLDACVMACP